LRIASTDTPPSHCNLSFKKFANIHKPTRFLPLNQILGGKVGIPQVVNPHDLVSFRIASKSLLFCKGEHALEVEEF